MKREGRKTHSELNPELVKLVKRLRRGESVRNQSGQKWHVSVVARV